MAPAATVSATGVASDSAHGQVTTSTETVIHSACRGSMNHQVSATAAASNSSAMMKWAAMRSAISTRRGFSVAARSIRRTIADSRVASPTCCT
jgi:hypothetical protein